MTTQEGETTVTIMIEPGAGLGGKVQAGDYAAPLANGIRYRSI